MVSLAPQPPGPFTDGQWVVERVWNGDQTDRWLNFSGKPHVLKMRLATYELERTDGNRNAN